MQTQLINSFSTYITDIPCTDISMTHCSHWNDWPLGTVADLAMVKLERQHQDTKITITKIDFDATSTHVQVTYFVSKNH